MTAALVIDPLQGHAAACPGRAEPLRARALRPDVPPHGVCGVHQIPCGAPASGHDGHAIRTIVIHTGAAAAVEPGRRPAHESRVCDVLGRPAACWPPRQ
jgi:hypothetical protein